MKNAKTITTTRAFAGVNFVVTVDPTGPRARKESSECIDVTVCTSDGDHLSGATLEPAQAADLWDACADPSIQDLRDEVERRYDIDSMDHDIADLLVEAADEAVGYPSRHQYDYPAEADA